MFITDNAHDLIFCGPLPVETRILLIIVRSLGLSENRPNYITSTVCWSPPADNTPGALPPDCPEAILVCFRLCRKISNGFLCLKTPSKNVKFVYFFFIFQFCCTRQISYSFSIGQYSEIMVKCKINSMEIFLTKYKRI